MEKEDRILEVLDKLITGQARLEAGQAKLEAGQAETNSRLSVIESEIRQLKEVDQFINSFALDAHERAEAQHKEVIGRLDKLQKCIDPMQRVVAKNSYEINLLQMHDLSTPESDEFSERIKAYQKRLAEQHI